MIIHNVSTKKPKKNQKTKKKPKNQKKTKKPKNQKHFFNEKNINNTWCLCSPLNISHL